MKNVSDTKSIKLNRNNHGAFVMMYTYKIGAKQWSDLVETEDSEAKEGESADDFIQRKS